MNTIRSRIMISFLCALTLSLCALADTRAAVGPSLAEKMATARVPFVPNQGQWDRPAAFAAPTFAGTLFVTTDGKLVYNLPGKSIGDTGDTSPDAGLSRVRDRRPKASGRTAGWVLTETFISADRKAIRATPTGDQPAATTASYFIGNDETRHQRGLETFGRIDLGEVFRGVNVQLRATGANVEKIFTVAPHQDPNQIRIEIGGATKLAVGRQGELIAETDNGPVTYTAPVAFQEDPRGNRQPVAVRYVLDSPGNQYRFALARYDYYLALVGLARSVGDLPNPAR